MKRPELRQVREPVIFLLGVGGALDKLFLHPTNEPYILAFVATLLGLPFFLHQDEKAKDKS